MPLGRVVAIEAEPPELAAPVVEPGVVADVDVPAVPLVALPDPDEPGACCLMVLVELPALIGHGSAAAARCRFLSM